MNQYMSQNKKLLFQVYFKKCETPLVIGGLHVTKIVLWLPYYGVNFRSSGNNGDVCADTDEL